MRSIALGQQPDLAADITGRFLASTSRRQLVGRFLPSPLLPLLLLIAGISVHDAWLLVVNQDVIYELEQNPIGRWLIRLDSGSVAMFVTVKLLTTAIVCAILATLFYHSRRLGWAVAWPIALFQTSLLTYLYTH
jgi:hypothetical protein